MADEVATLVIDHSSLNIVGAAFLEPEWFSSFDWPGQLSGTRRVKIGSTVYLLSDKADLDSQLVVLKVGPGQAFSGGDPQYVLDRIIHVALATFERTISLPLGWRPYNSGHLLSVFAYPERLHRDERIYFDRCPRGTNNLLLYAFSKNRDFNDVDHDVSTFDRGLAHYVEALLQPPSPERVGGGALGIVLSPPSGAAIVGSASLEDWYTKKLTDAQREFVDKAYDEPVRLKGAAGTGKTLSMTIKCLRDVLRADSDGLDRRFAFLTHSSAVAHETVPGMFDGLDPDWTWRRLRKSSVWVGSLYELAEDLLGYESKGLVPLSTDGREGRLFQGLEIYSAIERLRKNPMFMRETLRGCSQSFREDLERTGGASDRLVHELMNEFACVIDAENIRPGTPSGEKYIKASRERWQMILPEPADREAVLQIHDVYRSELEKSEVLSLDQMIADLNRYLGTHEWNRLRERAGFDAIFVDELHFFNRAERMVFHGLLTGRSTVGGKVPLFMSYDLKQSPTDSFLGYGEGESAATFFQRLRAGGSQLVELTEVFRSTPEITAFLGDLDAAFPALDLEGEWGGYAGRSGQTSGLPVQLREYARGTELVDATFRLAREDAIRFGGRNVAVLCMNEELFDRYLKAGRIADRFIELSGRDQVNQLKYAGRRCVFSMPEYVAGLQFKVVYLIHVDKAETVEDAATFGGRRRFVSKAYLGASRASEKLEIAVSRGRGGPSDILEVPLAKGTLVKVG